MDSGFFAKKQRKLGNSIASGWGREQRPSAMHGMAPSVQLYRYIRIPEVIQFETFYQEWVILTYQFWYKAHSIYREMMFYSTKIGTNGTPFCT